MTSLTLHMIVRKLRAQGDTRQAGVELPAGARTVSVRASRRGVDLVAWVVTADGRGRISQTRLGRVPMEDAVLSARLAPGTARVLGLQLALPESEQFTLAHRDAEGEVSAVPSGEVDLGPLVTDGRTVTDWHGWTLSTGGDV